MMTRTRLEVTCGICGVDNHIEHACNKGGTPRTDAEALKWGPYEGQMNIVIPAEFARQLEREVNALHAQIRLMDGEGKHYAAPDAEATSGREVPAAAPVAAPTPRTDAEEKGASYFTGVEIRQAWNLARQLEREISAISKANDRLAVQLAEAYDEIARLTAIVECEP